MTVRIAWQPDGGGGLWVGDCGCDPRCDWLYASGETCPLAVAGPGPVEGAGLMRSLTTMRWRRRVCPITVLPSLRPGPEPRPVRRRRERMTSLTDLREVVDVVIGVDHPRPHPLRGRHRQRDRWCPRRDHCDHRGGDCCGVCRAGGVREQRSDDAGLWDQLAIEGTGGRGAGLTRHLPESPESPESPAVERGA